MSDPIIKVEGLGKKYIISHEGKEKYTALRDVISRNAKKLVKRNMEKALTREEFWALKDVSFEIKQGEAVGIIGRNGAGKSTLLKILSRITEPTYGHIEMSGRVASLLEVGTGFHPELTGRENIYLNGAILGMSRAEIKRKFDEIVDFSGVEKFLDTPVKRYSSGMYVRLAFAVAAHLEPEILVVDEVLAVGDAEFQKKCLGKMDDVSKKEGRTVLFVSHNIAAVLQLCTKGIYLEKGAIKYQGDINYVVDKYSLEGSGENVSNFFEKPQSGKISLTFAESDKIVFGNKMNILLNIVSNSNEKLAVSVDFRINSFTKMPVAFASIGTFDYGKQILLNKGINVIQATIDIGTMAIGNYLISIDITKPNIEYYDRCEDCLTFEIFKEAEKDRVLMQNWNYGSIQLEASGVLK